MTITPFGWANSPSTSTPLDAAELESFGAHIGSYVDAETARAEAAEANSGGLTQLYNVGDGSLRNTRNGLARGLSGGAPLRVFVEGDSITAHYGASDLSHGYTSRLRANLVKKFGGASGEWLDATLLTYTGTNGVDYASNADNTEALGTGGTAGVSGYTGDHVSVCVKGGGSITVHVKVDGSVVDSFSTGSTSGVMVEHITAATVTSSVVVYPASSVINMIGIGVFTGDPSAAGVRLYSVGFPGTTAAQQLSMNGGTNVVQAWLGFMLPDLFIFEIGTNEYVNQNTLASFLTALDAVAVLGKAVNADVAFASPGPQVSPAQAIPIESYVAQMKQACLDEDVVMLDMLARWGTRDGADAAGLYTDDEHPSNFGHAEEANGLAALAG